MRPEILVGETAKLGATFVDRLEHQAAAAIAARGRFSLALPGGSAGRLFFPTLAAASVDWSRSAFFWMAQHDHVGILFECTDGIFEGFPL